MVVVSSAGGGVVAEVWRPIIKAPACASVDGAMSAHAYMLIACIAAVDKRGVEANAGLVLKRRQSVAASTGGGSEGQ